MFISDYSEKHGLTKTERKKLYALCKRLGNRFLQSGHYIIPDDMPTIYLPDYRDKDFYSHILKAVASQRLLLPESLNITPEAEAAMLDELAKNGVIRKIARKKKGQNTTDYVVTFDATKWASLSSAKKREFIKGLIKSLPTPNINITVKSN